MQGWESFLKIKKAGSYLLSRDGPSIIGAGELDFRVRNGNGYFLSAMATGILIYANLGEHPDALRAGRTPNKIRKTFLQVNSLPGTATIWSSLTAY